MPQTTSQAPLRLLRERHRCEVAVRLLVSTVMALGLLLHSTLVGACEIACAFGPHAIHGDQSAGPMAASDHDSEQWHGHSQGHSCVKLPIGASPFAGAPMIASDNGFRGTDARPLHQSLNWPPPEPRPRSG